MVSRNRKLQWNKESLNGRQAAATGSFLLLFTHSVMSDSSWPHGLQHARLPCPSASPGVHSKSCPLSRWCHPVISSAVIPFSTCLLSFSALGSYPMSWLFTSGGQSIGASTSASVLPRNIQGWFLLSRIKLRTYWFSSGHVKAPWSCWSWLFSGQFGLFAISKL